MKQSAIFYLWLRAVSAFFIAHVNDMLSGP